MLCCHTVFCWLIIPDSWLVSRVARRVYLFAAIANLALIVTIVPLGALNFERRGVPIAMNGIFWILLQGSVIVESFGAAILMSAMFYFWWNLDRTNVYGKAAWGAFHVALPLLAALAYFFAVYQRQARAVEEG